jgi:hypothetical protein
MHSVIMPSLEIFAVMEVPVSHFASLNHLNNWKFIWIFKPGQLQCTVQPTSDLNRPEDTPISPVAEYLSPRTCMGVIFDHAPKPTLTLRSDHTLKPALTMRSDRARALRPLPFQPRATFPSRTPHGAHEAIALSSMRPR